MEALKIPANLCLWLSGYTFYPNLESDSAFEAFVAQHNHLFQRCFDEMTKLNGRF